MSELARVTTVDTITADPSPPITISPRFPRCASLATSESRREEKEEGTLADLELVLGRSYSPERGKEPIEMAARKQGKNNFAVTCNLLSQYIKEKGRIADLGLGMAPRPQDATKGESLRWILMGK
ncbi:hypothetical protein GW17_00030240 [Ensete ventricosum]|nr:hypothetical protein GW17_00030240 [Ensete ventricosum]RZR87917.1 hypothetical protein BHM03_00015392 [Ensete ventricosum]